MRRGERRGGAEDGGRAWGGDLGGGPLGSAGAGSGRPNQKAARRRGGCVVPAQGVRSENSRCYSRCPVHAPPMLVPVSVPPASTFPPCPPPHTHRQHAPHLPISCISAGHKMCLQRNCKPCADRRSRGLQPSRPLECRSCGRHTHPPSFPLPCRLGCSQPGHHQL